MRLKKTLTDYQDQANRPSTRENTVIPLQLIEKARKNTT